MRNLIIKKDIKTNYLVYILATIAIVILSTVIAEGYPAFVDDFPQIVLFISVLAGILLFLLSLSLIVYILINNFYSDKHQNLLPQVKSMRKYLYYRFTYAYLSLIYFLLVGLITGVVTTELTWQMVLDLVNLMSVVIAINVGLVYFCFLMLAFFKTKYNFRIPIRALVASALLILSMLVTLFVAINIGFTQVIFCTTISVVMGIVLIALIFSSSPNYKKRFLFIDLVLILIVLAIGTYYTYDNSSSYADGTGDPDYYTGEQKNEYTESYSSDYEIFYEGESDLGLITVTNSASGFEYSIYIEGEYSFSADYSGPKFPLSGINYKTGESITIFTGDEGYIDYNSKSLEDGQMMTCYSSGNYDASGISSYLDDIECANKEQIELIKQVYSEIDSIINDISKQ